MLRVDVGELMAIVVARANTRIVTLRDAAVSC